jgi:hypothetical protein
MSVIVSSRKMPPLKIVVTENSVRSENTGVPIIREMILATTMRSLFVALFALVASRFRTRDALRAEIVALENLEMSEREPFILFS